jgi:hypothetical protein
MVFKNSANKNQKKIVQSILDKRAGDKRKSRVGAVVLGAVVSMSLFAPIFQEAWADSLPSEQKGYEALGRRIEKKRDQFGISLGASAAGVGLFVAAQGAARSANREMLEAEQALEDARRAAERCMNNPHAYQHVAYIKQIEETGKIKKAFKEARIVIRSTQCISAIATVLGAWGMYSSARGEEPSAAVSDTMIKPVSTKTTASASVSAAGATPQAADVSVSPAQESQSVSAR